ncbi:MAG: N-methyl-D-aspartate receptor NMDAR2C subunit [Variovorax sp.]
MNSETALRDAWADALALLGCHSTTSTARLFDSLVTAYREPQRHYHSLQHLGECLSLARLHRAQARQPGEVAMALWFHDAVYDVHAHDNEQRSADWASDALRAAGVGAGAAQRVHALVMATCHDAQPVDDDARLLVDIDLSILGAPPDRFAEYEQQIRREYAHVPREIFEPRRREILGRFLARDPLYLTPTLRAEREAQARINLACAIG